jgi:hypothetical protein
MGCCARQGSSRLVAKVKPLMAMWSRAKQCAASLLGQSQSDDDGAYCFVGPESWNTVGLVGNNDQWTGPRCKQNGGVLHEFLAQWTRFNVECPLKSVHKVSLRRCFRP